MTSSGWNRVSRANKCPICGKPDWCLVSEDGLAVICPRTPSDKRVGDAGWLHKPSELLHTPIVKTAPLEVPDFAPPAWAERVDACHADMKDYQWDFLKSNTGCSVESLRRIRAGWSQSKGAYTFPMRNGKGQVCGVRLRYPSGKKSSVKGSRNGLFMDPDVEMPRSGRVYVCEGPTDTAAMLSLGLVAVGRPSCNTGSKFLCDLIPFANECVVVADKDKPGRDGAKLVATQLAKAKRSAKVIEPKDGGDANEWVQRGATKAVVEIIAEQAKEIR